MTIKNPIFCAIDTADPGRAGVLATTLANNVGGLKLGLEFIYGQGLRAIDLIDGIPLFLDVKLLDIPTTVARAVSALVPKSPYMLNVHAQGGRDMMRAAAKAAKDTAEQKNIPRPLVIAVTVLTSLDDSAIAEIGISGGVTDQVRRLAGMAQECGLDGVVCSALEARMLRSQCGSDFTLVVPGVRPEWAATNDQKRMMTPAEALDAGASILVIGRPITDDPDPAAALQRILDEIKSATGRQ